MSTTPAAQQEPLHPNHRPDLRYVLKVLERAVPFHKHDSLRGQIEAAIVGMRYIIERTEAAAQAHQEAQHPAPAVQPPSPQPSNPNLATHLLDKAPSPAGEALRPLIEKLINSALDSDASGRPEGGLAQYALELRAALQQTEQGGE